MARFFLSTTLLSSLVRLAASKVVHISLVSHDEVIQRQRQLLKGSSGSDISKQQIDALYQGYGTHYIDLWVGTPPQRQTVIVGTGSPKTAFPCSKCLDCGELYHTDAYFLEEASSTYRSETCQTMSDCTYGLCSDSGDCTLSTSYLEGSSWRGIESIDIIYAGGPHSRLQNTGVFSSTDLDDADPMRAKNFAFEQTFACMSETTGLFKTQMADGIMGMDNAKESFWHQAFDHQVIDKRAFALCLSRQETFSKQGTEAGALTMGGHDKRLHTSPMVYSKLDSSQFFSVNLKKMYLREGGGGDSVLATKTNLTIEALNVNDSVYELYSRVTIDSGTTDSYFPRGLAPAFKALWKELTGKEYHHQRVFLTDEDLNSLPTILLQLEGHVDLNNAGAENDPSKVPGLAASVDPSNPYDILIAIPPSHYMQRDYTTQGAYVARYHFDEQGYTAVVGANTMMGHDILFDVEEGAMGFAESHCDYTRLEEIVEEEEEEAGVEISKGKDTTSGKKDTTIKAEKLGAEEGTDSTNYSPVDSNRDRTGMSVLSGLVAVIIFVVGYVAYDKFGGREILARRHGRVPVVEDMDEHELELQEYSRPIV
mmetsp:Transcript_15716/g.23010  ORF Transcript_15716/g.23010 Transcript_15716/m.23010 type:complete len:594 (+) Transcript_15716:75-1856(+)